MEDAVAIFFDGLADRWDEIAVHPRERVDRVLDLAGPLSGLSVLDLGSGTGVLIDPLLARVGSGGRVLALDVSPRMIAASRRAHAAANLEFVVADFLSWFPSEAFDLVVAYSCFPHFLDRAAFWRAARGCLKPRGRVLIAHIEGRAAINALHGEDGHDAISLPLSPVAELASQAELFGFEVLRSGDDDESYYLLAASVDS